MTLKRVKKKKENPLSLSSLPSLPAGPTPIPLPFSFSPQTLSGRWPSFPRAQAAHAGPSSPSAGPAPHPSFLFWTSHWQVGPDRHALLLPSAAGQPRPFMAHRPPPPCPSPSTGAINLAMKLPLHSPSLIDRYPLNPPSPLNSLSRPAIDGHGRWGTASLRHPEPI
jgi:hypothetical protein